MGKGAALLRKEQGHIIPDTEQEVKMMATKLSLILRKARENRSMKFNNLMHLINERNLKECFARLKKNKAPGVDKVTLEEYGENLTENVKDLVARLKQMSYRPQPVRGAKIPKDKKGDFRKLGIPTIEDKLVQMAFARILDAIWEADFIAFSYGFRRGFGAQRALVRLDKVLMKQPVGYVIDADIEGYFDNVDHEKIMDCLKQRISDKKFLRYILRMLKSGIVEGRNYYATEKGTPQGGIVSPIIANVYLHFLLDRWFIFDILPNCKGKADMIRYCDDFLICVEEAEDAKYILLQLEQRLGKGKLKLSKEKTKVVEFRRPPADDAGNKGRKPETFEFLGFTHYWEKSRKGLYIVGRRTGNKRFRKAIGKVKDFLRTCRNKMPLKDIWQRVTQKLHGHYAYYGVSGNYRKIKLFHHQVERLLFKWLNRRSQRKSFNWEQYSKYEQRFPLPKPKIHHRLYQTA
jgi:group II intron reverse transcriptase/maturase